YHELLKSSRVRLNRYKIYSNKKELADTDFFISLGGDGTLLESVTHIERLEIPILGINIGRLGFLATTPKFKIKEAIDALYNNLFSYDYRALIKLESDKDIFGNQSFGMNEF